MRAYRLNWRAVLAGASAVGVGASVICAIRDTKKMCKALAVIPEEEQPETVAEKVKFAAPYYIPTMISTGATLGCIGLGHKINARTIASIGGVAAVTEKTLRNYRERIKEEVGEEREKELFIEAAKDDWCMWPQLPCTDDSWCNKYTFFDTYTKRFFTCSIERIQQAIYHLNRQFKLRGDITLGEFFEFIGLKKDDRWYKVGWSYGYFVEGMGWELDPWIDITFSKGADKDNKPIYYIYYEIEPTIEALVDLYM